jgi:hypothetical protein
MKLGIYSLVDDIDNKYIESVLRQTFVVMFLQKIIILLNIIDSIPIINIFSLFNYISFFLIILSYLVLIPTGLINIIFKYISSKLYFLKNDILLTEPLSDKIIKFIKHNMGDTKALLVNLKNCMNYYDNKDIDDINTQNIISIIQLFNDMKIIFMEKCNIDIVTYIYMEMQKKVYKISNKFTNL